MRGQTTLDFATGVSVFLLTILFVFTFVPGILTPFTDSAQEDTVTANRLADLVSKDILADPAEPYRLNATCTEALISDSSVPGCEFDGSTLSARLDLSAQQSVNITFTGYPENTGSADRELLCWDSGNEEVVLASDGDCDTELRTGPNPPQDSQSVVTARRIVTIDGKTATMEVKTW